MKINKLFSSFISAVLISAPFAHFSNAMQPSSGAGNCRLCNSELNVPMEYKSENCDNQDKKFHTYNRLVALHGLSCFVCKNCLSNIDASSISAEPDPSEVITTRGIVGGPATICRLLKINFLWDVKCPICKEDLSDSINFNDCLTDDDLLKKYSGFSLDNNDKLITSCRNRTIPDPSLTDEIKTRIRNILLERKYKLNSKTGKCSACSKSYGDTISFGKDKKETKNRPVILPCGCEICKSSFETYLCFYDEHLFCNPIWLKKPNLDHSISYCPLCRKKISCLENCLTDDELLELYPRVQLDNKNKLCYSYHEDPRMPGLISIKHSDFPFDDDKRICRLYNILLEKKYNSNKI